MKERIKSSFSDFRSYVILGVISVVVSLFGLGITSEPISSEIGNLETLQRSEDANAKASYQQVHFQRMIYRSISLSGLGLGTLLFIYGLHSNIARMIVARKEESVTKDIVRKIDDSTPEGKAMSEEVQALHKEEQKPQSQWLSEIYQHVLGDDKESR